MVFTLCYEYLSYEKRVLKIYVPVSRSPLFCKTFIRSTISENQRCVPGCVDPSECCWWKKKSERTNQWTNHMAEHIVHTFINSKTIVMMKWKETSIHYPGCLLFTPCPKYEIICKYKMYSRKVTPHGVVSARGCVSRLKYERANVGYSPPRR